MTRKKSVPLRSTGKRTTTTLPAVIRVRGLRSWLFGAVGVLGITVCVALAVAFEVPRRVALTLQETTAAAGFDVADVEIVGIRHTPRVAVHVAVSKAGGSMLFTDVDAVRTAVEQIPWVERATVSRQLPDRMRIQIVERRPFALWQHQHRLAVIDAHGVVLQTRNIKAFMALPLVVGEGANVRAATLFADMGQVPAIRRKIDSAQWIGNRRWDVQFKSGETLQLPEGRRESQAALVAFAQLDAANQLLGRGLGQFDMRVADRLFVRNPLTGTNMTQTSVTSERSI